MKKYTQHPDCDADHPDFTIRSIPVFQDDVLDSVELLLPVGERISQLVNQRGAEARARLEAQKRVAAIRTEGFLEKVVKTPEPRANDREGGRFSPAVEREALLTQYSSQRELFEAASDQVQIYHWDEPCRLLESAASSPDRQLRDRDHAIFSTLKAHGAFRRVSDHRSAYVALETIQEMRRRQPHFGEVLDLIEGQVLIACETGKPIRLRPMLVTGEPGVGKTHFSLELARGLARSIHSHSFDLGYTGSALLGSDRYWANTKPGVVFEAICMSRQADPIILLDEIDKATSSSQNNPLAPLHRLLEPLTAKNVKDISAGITFDASHVFWLATANDSQSIPAPILSRFRVFHIQAPTAAQAIDMARSVAAEVHENFLDFEPPDKRLITLLAHLTPREQIQTLEDAFARALVNGRKHLVRQDLPAHLLTGEVCGANSDRFWH